MKSKLEPFSPDVSRSRGIFKTYGDRSRTNPFVPFPTIWSTTTSVPSGCRKTVLFRRQGGCEMRWSKRRRVLNGQIDDRVRVIPSAGLTIGRLRCLDKCDFRSLLTLIVGLADETYESQSQVLALVFIAEAILERKTYCACSTRRELSRF